MSDCVLSKGLVVAIVAFTRCRKPVLREAYAVGTYVGGGSFLFGPMNCVYEALPEVAELSTNREGKKFMAKLVGEGTITETCGATKTVYDVAKATAGRIDGPSTWQGDLEPTSARFRFVPMAGSRELRGIDQEGESPVWSLGKDCDGVAVFGAVLGSQDSGGPAIVRSLVAEKDGSCTLTATVLGVTATKTVRVSAHR